MQRDQAVELCRPHFGRIVEAVRTGYERVATSIVPGCHAVLLPAYPKMANCLIVAELQEAFGTDRPCGSGAWMGEVCKNPMLLVVGEGEASAGLRPKKYDCDFRTSQHSSQTQDRWRREGQLYIEGLPRMAHLFVGYRTTEGLEPQLRDISISFERQTNGGGYGVVWHYRIWSEGEGELYDLPPAPTLFPPPSPQPSEQQPGFRAKPKRTRRIQGEGRSGSSTG